MCLEIHRRTSFPLTLNQVRSRPLAHHFYQEHTNRRLEDGADQQWRVGKDENTITIEDLNLLSLHHVSFGSWQPQLQLSENPRYHSRQEAHLS